MLRYRLLCLVWRPIEAATELYINEVRKLEMRIEQLPLIIERMAGLR